MNKDNNTISQKIVLDEETKQRLLHWKSVSTKKKLEWLQDALYFGCNNQVKK